MNTCKMVKVFLTSIDSGSFTKAGEILGYTQSNLTQMMKSFEDELGIPLLIKTKRGVEPTGEAKLLIPSVRRRFSCRKQTKYTGYAEAPSGSARMGVFLPHGCPRCWDSFSLPIRMWNSTS